MPVAILSLCFSPLLDYCFIIREPWLPWEHLPERVNNALISLHRRFIVSVNCASYSRQWHCSSWCSGTFSLFTCCSASQWVHMSFIFHCFGRKNIFFFSFLKQADLPWTRSESLSSGQSVWRGPDWEALCQQRHWITGKLSLHGLLMWLALQSQLICFSLNIRGGWWHSSLQEELLLPLLPSPLVLLLARLEISVWGCSVFFSFSACPLECLTEDGSLPLTQSK